MSAADEEERVFLTEQVAVREAECVHKVACWEPTSELFSRLFCSTNPALIDNFADVCADKE